MRHMCSDARKEKVLAWMYSEPMWASPEVLQSLGWSLIEPYRTERHWEDIQDNLARLVQEGHKL